jgi:hypothetical protein
MSKVAVNEDAVRLALGLEGDCGLNVVGAMMGMVDWPSVPVAIYALATIHHETGGSFEPRLEPGAEEDFINFEPDTVLGVMLGNRFPGDGFLFRRRGYMPIVGRQAYTVFGSRLKLKLIDHPEHLLEPEHAFTMLREGMIQGLYTGRKIKEFINANLANYVEARRVFNRLNHANVIADYALAIAATEGVTLAEEH